MPVDLHVPRVVTMCLTLARPDVKQTLRRCLVAEKFVLTTRRRNVPTLLQKLPRPQKT